MIHAIRTIDAHVGGQPLRLVVEGMPVPEGGPLLRQRERLSRQADAFRRALLTLPRGHADMTAVMLTRPHSPGAHAGLLFLDAHGYPVLSGHAVIAATTIALERRLLFSSDHDAEAPQLVFDTPAGTVQALARLETHGDHVRVDTVTVTGVPAFVLAAGLPVKARGRELRVDVAFGGAFYAVVDTEAAGVPLGFASLPDLRRLGVEICRGFEGASRPVHPVEAALGGLSGVIFTGAPDDPEAHLRNVTVGVGGSVDLSPGGTGTAAVMAVLDAMGLLGDGQPFVHEGLTGAVLRGRVAGRAQVGEVPAVVPEISGSAWITGESTFLLDDDDPFRTGVAT